MARLITFGCSFTAGIGLPDIYPRHDTTSSLGWPALLGKKLNLELVNKGKGGTGNLEILCNILNTDFEDTDTVVILWSSFLRHDRFVIDSDLKSGSRMSEEEFLLNVFKIESPDWVNSNRNKNWLTIHHASCYLKTLGINFYSLLGIVNRDNSITGDRPDHLDIPNFIEDIRPGHWIVDEALDGKPNEPGHPGLESQRLLSQMIYDRIV